MGAPRQIANRGFERNSLPRFRAEHVGFAVAIDALAPKIAVNVIAGILKLSGKRRNVRFRVAQNRFGDRGASVIRSHFTRHRWSPLGSAFAASLQGGLLPWRFDRGGHARRSPELGFKPGQRGPERVAAVAAAITQPHLQFIQFLDQVRAAFAVRLERGQTRRQQLRDPRE